VRLKSPVNAEGSSNLDESILLFAWKLIRGNCARLEGTAPVSLLPLIRNVVSFMSLLSWDGTVDPITLNERSNTTRFVRYPSSVGIDPAKLLVLVDRNVKPVTAPMEVGICPPSAQESRIRVVSPVNFPNDDTRFPAMFLEVRSNFVTTLPVQVTPVQVLVHRLIAVCPLQVHPLKSLFLTSALMPVEADISHKACS